MTTISTAYFDDLYAHRDDPWRLEERWYERRKRALTMASLPHERYERALEIGCSVGTLTVELANRCARLVAVDAAAKAVELARERLGAVDSVELAVLSVPQDWPDGSFDLIVMSEVGYYFDEPTLEAVITRLVASLTEEGVLTACHWRHPVADYPLAGDRVHELLRARPDLHIMSRYVDEDVRLEVFTKNPTSSVAAREGLVANE